MSNITENVKKNLLDLQYARYLQAYHTSIIVLFTYVIGITIAAFAKQIDFTDSTHTIFLVFTSGVLFGPIGAIIRSTRNHLHNIQKEIKKLRV
jgi:hypothetical protein|tara:strand:+ start:88 stop:366 length:279 start_codon:yes stop_codon:yes gene_type:complete